MSAMTRVNINADMGEGFGRWTLGDDAALMPYIASTNIACGYHGGDPHLMRACVALAKEHGVEVGAHVGFPDLIGFGRRRVDVTVQELKDYVTYQVGALMGFAAAEGTSVAHVKPHSALYKTCLEEERFAEAMAEAVAALDRDLVLVLGGVAAAAARQAEVPFVLEGFADLEYEDDGAYVPEWPKRDWEPAVVAARAVRLARDGEAESRGGRVLRLRVGTLCIHGEAANAASIAKAVKEELAAAGIAVVSLREMAARAPA